LSSDLAILLQHHTLWSQLCVLDNGATFPLNPISNQERQSDLTFHIKRGNHRSSEKNKDILDQIINKCTERGLWSASLVLLRCQKQPRVDEFNNKIPNFRMTHDQTFPSPSLPVNLHVKIGCLPLIVYSFILSWSIQYIVKIHSLCPSTKFSFAKSI
jgi:hypothetical protein